MDWQPQVSLSFTNSQSLLKLMSIRSVMPSNHLILCHPRLLVPSIYPNIKVFFNESVLRIRRPKYCSFSFSLSPSNEYSGMISFRMDWLDLLVVQETQESSNNTVQKHQFFGILEWAVKPADLPHPGMKPESPASLYHFTTEPLGKPRYNTHQFSSVQSLSRVRLFSTPWIAAHQASLSITNSRSLLKLMPIDLVMPSSHLILCHPLLLLPPIPPSIRVFPNESTLCTRWPKYWSFSFSISPSNEHPGLISFRMDWLDLLSVKGTLKSFLKHHSSKTSIFQVIYKKVNSFPGNSEQFMLFGGLQMKDRTRVHSRSGSFLFLLCHLE